MQWIRRHIESLMLALASLILGCGAAACLAIAVIENSIVAAGFFGAFATLTIIFGMFWAIQIYFEGD